MAEEKTMKKPAACVIGYPADHSRSPLIHNYWIEQLGLDAEYRRESVSPEEFPDFIAHLAGHGYVGANVTIPHKETVMKLATPDAHAEALGAANTLWFEGKTLRATNTDVEGFLDSLDAQVPRWDSGLDNAMVLGAGGAARAIVAALKARHVREIRVANRTFGRAEALREKFGSSVLPTEWNEVNGILASADLVVNTTSLGMVGQPPLELKMRALKPSTVIADIVYAPLETQLLKGARDRGLRTADGLGMLLHQAVRGFFLWFGVKPQVTPELRALVVADLTENATQKAHAETAKPQQKPE